MLVTATHIWNRNYKFGRNCNISTFFHFMWTVFWGGVLLSVICRQLCSCATNNVPATLTSSWVLLMAVYQFLKDSRSFSYITHEICVSTIKSAIFYLFCLEDPIALCGESVRWNVGHFERQSRRISGECNLVHRLDKPSPVFYTGVHASLLW